MLKLDIKLDPALVLCQFVLLLLPTAIVFFGSVLVDLFAL